MSANTIQGLKAVPIGVVFALAGFAGSLIKDRLFVQTSTTTATVRLEDQKADIAELKRRADRAVTKDEFERALATMDKLATKDDLRAIEIRIGDLRAVILDGRAGKR